MDASLLAEVDRILDGDDTRLGQVWKFHRQGHSAKEIAQRLGIGMGLVHNVSMQIGVLRGDPLPKRQSRALKAAHKAGAWLTSKSTSPALTRHLNGILDAYQELTRSLHDHPAVEWVKRPVDRTTGQPTGKPIRMRHLPDGCTHFYTDPGDSARLLGEPLRLATDDEMELPACNACVESSDKAGFPRSGPRVPVPDQDVQSDGSAKRPVYADTDRQGSVTLRREQSALRASLLTGQEEAPCLLCGRVFPKALLIAAHIVPRRELTHDQRLKFSAAAFLACAAGCDALFEHGYLTVGSSGVVAPGRQTSGDVAALVSGLLGRSLTSVTPEQRAQFARHRAGHLASKP
ncbi:hypothetical protein GHK92_14955 [Nocardioides sp. dk4132]|uniref:hypothetical protein n=1 Tax=Nocardioides TaxID=1839 RepID=UPI000FD8625F|nr:MULTISPECIES: hypothetical protein [Nocardioides]MQW77175.1 hypothetical protein [Nocardioides sp. dk4132]QGA07940.1 hypothetical protein GFH29_11430 [Nocardioides sp. dk884]